MLHTIYPIGRNCRAPSRWRDQEKLSPVWRRHLSVYCTSCKPPWCRQMAWRSTAGLSLPPRQGQEIHWSDRLLIEAINSTINIDWRVEFQRTVGMTNWRRSQKPKPNGFPISNLRRVYIQWYCTYIDTYSIDESMIAIDQGPWQVYALYLIRESRMIMWFDARVFDGGVIL